MHHPAPPPDCSPAQYATHWSPGLAPPHPSPAQAYPPPALDSFSCYLATPQTASNASYSADLGRHYLAPPVQEGTPVLCSPQSVSSQGDHFSHAYEYQGQGQGYEQQGQGYQVYEQGYGQHIQSDQQQQQQLQ